MVNAGTDATAGGSVISLPSGGGAIGGLGETFSADLFTGTGNFSVPITLPAGRNGLAPQLSLGYSTGNGNGPFGLGWAAEPARRGAQDVAGRAPLPTTTDRMTGRGTCSSCPAPRTWSRSPTTRAAGSATDRAPRGCSPASSTCATTRATTGKSAAETGC